MESAQEPISELDILKKRFIERLEGNYPHLTKYLYDRLKWCELNFIKGEILNCLMLGLGIASITLTNHLLEKVMKLALVYNQVGVITMSRIEDVEAYKEAYEMYGDLNLFATINSCYDAGLISTELKDALHKYRSRIRNGFSHASPSKTFGITTAKFVMGSFSKPGLSEVKESKISVLPPFIQAYATNEFVEANALPYFDLVYNVVKTLEKAVDEKHKK